MARNLRSALRQSLKSSVAGGLGNNDIFTTASLDLNFAKYKNLGTIGNVATGQNLVDFTRASSGTYVGSDGLIKTATTNLVLRSEEFDNASWTKVGLLAFGSGSVADAVIAPDGSLTADLLTESTASNAQRNLYQSGFTASTSTLSCYVKPHGRNFVGLRFYNSSGNWVSVTFSLTGLGAATDVFAGTSSTYSATNASISLVGDGWYRVSLTATKSGGINFAVIDFATKADPILSAPSGNEFYAGDGTSGIYLWGAQLEQSSTVGEYIKTTSTINSAPRFDHDPTTGESLGLLREEQRQNLLLRSEEFDQSPWSIVLGSITANSELSPDGTTTADKLITNSGAALLNAYALSGSISKAAAATTYTLSIFAKPDGFDTVLILPFDASTLNNRAFVGVNVATGAITTAAGTAGTFTGASAQVTQQANGWYRVSLTFTSSTETSLLVRVSARDSSATTGDGTSGLYIWGAQLEQGSLPTSYIPTTTSAVTRAADVASISGSNFSSWYRQDEGTLFADSQRLALPPASEFPQVFFVSDGTGDNTINLGYITSSVSQFRVRRLASNEANPTPGTSALRRVTAGAYAPNDAAVSETGSPVLVDTSVVLPSALDQLNIGSGQSGVFPLNGTIRRLTYWPVRLGNTTLQQITQ